MIAHEHPNPFVVLDAVIADMRASGDTGHVENLLQARKDFADLIDGAKDYFGPMDDPSIGWCDPKPSRLELFKCEKCGAEHIDCFLIPHIKNCRAVRLRDALIRIGGAP